MKELHSAINEQRTGAGAQSEEGPASLQGVTFVLHITLYCVCKLFLAFVDGVQRQTVIPDFNRSTICHDHTDCRSNSIEAFSASLSG